MSTKGFGVVTALAGVAGWRHQRPRPVAMRPEGIGGWLLVYVIALVILLLHGIEHTVAVVIIYANPSLAGGLHTFVPLGSLLFYMVTNVVLAVSTIVVFFLMFRKRRAAIIANIVFNALSASLVVAWHFLGMTSQVGTIVDALPGLVGLSYFLVSKRVRNTFARAIDEEDDALAP